jgi:hypothetical protein
MNTLNFPDANAWLALLWNRHVHSETARLWFEQAEQQQFFFCRFTQLTVLRLLTAEKILGATPRPGQKPGAYGIEFGLTIALSSLPSPMASKGSSARVHGCPAHLLRFGLTLIFWLLRLLRVCSSSPLTVRSRRTVQTYFFSTTEQFSFVSLLYR